MKHGKWLASWVAIAATFLIAWMQMSLIALAEGKPATSATIQANKQVLQDLPFDDIEDFLLTRKGFIDKLDPVLIPPDTGAIWDLEQFQFLLGGESVPSNPRNLPDAPNTVNPSLWRQAQLNMQHGLYEVVPGIYQLRGYDVSVMSLVEGDTGWIVIDPYTTNETAHAALDLANANISQMDLPRHPHRLVPLPISAVIYTHIHADHFGGVEGIVNIDDVKSASNSEGISIYAPEGFVEEATSEKTLGGNAMGRRSSYMYGSLLPKGPKEMVDTGLGKGTPNGTISLIAPTDLISYTGQTINVDGIDIVFQYVPDTEAPVEMMFYFPEFHALCTAEDATHTMHNLYTLRGAPVRDGLAWAKYLNETISLFGDDVEVVFASHHWPIWDKGDTDENEVVEYLKKQRDLYKYIHDQTLHLANEGYTMLEIAEMLELPDSLAIEWYNRGYYGSLNHDVKAVYQKYLGWFDGNPAHLYSLPPEQAGAKYIEYMGGPEVAIQQAQADFDNGEYRWVAQVMSDLVFGFCKNNLPPYPNLLPLDRLSKNCFDATQLEADALEQLGYQTESGPWRNIFLTGTKELREGVPGQEQGTTSSAFTDFVVGPMSSDLFFDGLSVLLDGPAAANYQYTFNLIFPDRDERYLLEVTNGVLNYTSDKLTVNPNTTIVINRSDLEALILEEKEISEVDFSYGGELQDFRDFLSLLDEFKSLFNIVLP